MLYVDAQKERIPFFKWSEWLNEKINQMGQKGRKSIRSSEQQNMGPGICKIN